MIVRRNVSTYAPHKHPPSRVMSTGAACSSQPCHDPYRIAHGGRTARAPWPAIPHPRARRPVLGSERGGSVAREVGPQDSSGDGEVGHILIASSDPAVLPRGSGNLERPVGASLITDDGAVGSPATFDEVDRAGKLREIGCARGGEAQEEECDGFHFATSLALGCTRITPPALRNAMCRSVCAACSVRMRSPPRRSKVSDA